MKGILQLIMFLGLTTHLFGQQHDVFQTGKVKKKKFCDTIWIQKSEFIVLPMSISGTEKNYMFDTGADLIVTSGLDSTTLSQIKIKLSDANGLQATKDLHQINSVNLNGIEVRNVYSIDFELPAPLTCFVDGIIGNNLIRALNWEIYKDYIVVSNKKMKYDFPLQLNTFFRGANRMLVKTRLNGFTIDTCLIDYGGLFEINLPKTMYSNNMLKLKENFKNNYVKASYGVHGLGTPDTVTIVNCDIDFNGVEIKSVNISFGGRTENQIGILFLKRFQSVLIDNNRDKIAFGELLAQNKNSNIQTCDFDLVNDTFVVKSAILNDTALLEYGDKFISINNKASDSFENYCEFLEWKKTLADSEFLELIRDDGEKLKINW